MTGTLIAGQIQPFWYNVTNSPYEAFILRLDTVGAEVAVTKNNPLPDVLSSSYIDYFCGGDCFNSPDNKWAIEYNGLSCPGRNGNGLYYVNVYQEYYNNTFAFTLTLFNPVMQLGVPLDYPLNAMGFIVSNMTVPSNTSLRVYTRIYSTRDDAGSDPSGTGTSLRRATTCVSVAPYNNNPNTGLITSFVLTNVTNVKNTDKFYVRTFSNWFINEGQRTGGLETGNRVCAVICVDGTDGCNVCGFSTGTRLIGTMKMVVLAWLWLLALVLVNGK